MSIPVTTTFNFEGYRIKEYKGIARGIIVRAPTIAQGIVGGLKGSWMVSSIVIGLKGSGMVDSIVIGPKGSAMVDSIVIGPKGRNNLAQGNALGFVVK